jgi:hypothetical protein
VTSEGRHTVHRGWDIMNYIKQNLIERRRNFLENEEIQDRNDRAIVIQ